MHARMRRTQTKTAVSHRWPDALRSVLTVGTEDPAVAAHLGISVPTLRGFSVVHDWIERVMSGRASQRDLHAFDSLIDHFIFKLTLLFVHCAQDVSPIPAEGLTVFRGMNIEEVAPGSMITLQNPACSFVSTTLYCEVAGLGDYVSGNCIMLIRAHHGVPALYVPSIVGMTNITKREFELLLGFALTWSLDRAWISSSGQYVLVCSVRADRTIQNLFAPNLHHRHPRKWRTLYDLALQRRNCGPLSVRLDAHVPSDAAITALVQNGPPLHDDMENVMEFLS